MGSLSENLVNAISSVPLKAAQYVTVDIECQSHRAVPEALLDNLRVHTSGEQKRSGRMTQIVETNFVWTRAFLKRPPGPSSEIVLPHGDPPSEPIVATSFRRYSTGTSLTWAWNTSPSSHGRPGSTERSSAPTEPTRTSFTRCSPHFIPRFRKRAAHLS